MTHDPPDGPADDPADDHALRPWRTLDSRAIYRNPWISVREDRVERPDGGTGIYGVVTCAPCVGVLPFVADDHVMLVRQWRYIVDRPTWEMPTGGCHQGESAEAAAQRELAEEIGRRATSLVPVSTFSTSKSVVDETATLFLAYGLVAAEGEPDETEVLQVATFGFDEVVAMVLSGEIIDAMTIIAVLLADRERRLS